MVDCTLFGAFIKQADSHEEGSVVWEKAHVVVKAIKTGDDTISSVTK